MKPILLIDVDGTLTDSYPGIRASFLHALSCHGIALPDEDFLARIPGPPMVETLAALGLPPSIADATLQDYLQHQDAGGWTMASPFPGMKELLRSWREQGIVLSTATSKSEKSARRLLEKFDLFEYFHVFAGAEEDGTRRSKKAVIRHALAQLRHVPGVLEDGANQEEIDPARILMIGDRKHDVEGAAAFGIDTALVTWGYGTAEEHNAAAYSVNTPEELDALVRERTSTYLG